MNSASPLPQRLIAGWTAIDRDDFSAAEKIARNALREDPSDLESLRLLGDSLFYQDRFKDAIAPLREVFDRAPKKGVGHRLGYCHLALGDLRSAESVLRREIEFHPDRVNAYNALGIALKRHDEAIASFQKALNIAPGLTYTLGNLVRNEIAICQWANLERHIGALRERIRQRATVEEPFTLVAVSDSPQGKRSCAEAYLQDKFPVPPPPLWQGTRYRHEKIRLAYLSSDFQ